MQARRVSELSRGGWGLALLTLLLGLGVPAFAVDGVIEINQAKVLAGGVTTGDFPNYPVTISQSGSYRLTGDLSVPTGINGFYIDADNVTLDLNGFTLFGGLGAISDGISIGLQKNVEIRNGTVRNFSRHGIFTNSAALLIRVIGVRAIGNSISGIEIQGAGGLVDGCTAASNGSGIRVIDGSLVINSVSRGNTGLGLLMGPTSGYRSNVLTGNNGGDANPQATGTGLQLGSNVCGSDLICP